MPKFRTERDSLGEMKVPADAWYGAQTARAVENFPISGIHLPRSFIGALGVIKGACARANADGGDLDRARADAIVRVSQEVADGKLDDQFVVDVYQTGSGTSTNMNANEVIARRATEILASRETIHPNDHVNMSQSSNDVIPTAIHVAAATEITKALIPALEQLGVALEGRSVAFDDVIKSGRTHLMDATPVRLGQEFGAWAQQLTNSVDRATRARDVLLEVALGGTAVGTGINRRAGFPAAAIGYICAATGLNFYEAVNHFEAQGARDACVEASGELRTIAVSLSKVAGDIRLLASGPRTGLAEIRLPALAPGSSIMPGKVNPVLCEAVTMVSAQVIGHDTAITHCGMGGALELNVMMPLIAHNLLESIRLVANVCGLFAERCVSGIEANIQHTKATLERNLSLVTALAPRIGYDRAAAIAKEAFASGRTIREVAGETKVLPDDELDRLLDGHRMTEPESND